MSGTLVTGNFPNGLALTNANYTYVSIAATAAITNPAGAALFGANTIALTIANSGTVEATGTTTASYGILLAGGNTVTNVAGGLIGGVSGGIDITAVGSVENAGSITGARGNGIVLQAGGQVVNAASGSVAGYAMGITEAGTGTVINAGTISSSQTSGGGASYNTATGLTVLDGGVVLNSGSVSNDAGATISSYFFGVAIYSAGSVTNAGLIAGTGTNEGIGVLLPSPGFVSNAASGTITGVYFGVLQRKGVGTVDNLGTITSTHTMGGAVVRLLKGGTIGNEASGTISGKWIGAQIYSNAPGSAPGTVLNQGLILAADTIGDGAGAWIKGPGTISNAASGTIRGGAFGVVSYNYADTIVNQGRIYGSNFAVQMGSGGANRVIVYPGASFGGPVNAGNALTATAASALELAAGSAIGSITGFGSMYVDFAQVTIDTGATWSLAGTVVAGETISFGGAGGVLTLANPGSVAGTITGFSTGNTIALGGITDATSATLGAGNLLTVARSSGPSITLQLDPNQTFTGSNFPVTVADGNADLVVPCFAAGTRIATASGELPVEALRAGDRVVSALGGTAPVVWVGHRRIECRRHNRPDLVMPVRVRAGAFGDGLPTRDLRLSPDHAVFIYGVLIPIRALINGGTVAQERVGHITYHHVELASHGVMLAEGLPAESYLDTGNRGAFDNGSGAFILHPDFARRAWDRNACAELIFGGPILAAVRQRLLLQACLLGYATSDDPDLRLRVAQRTLYPDRVGLGFRFMLPRGARAAHLLSRVRADSIESRVPGVEVAELLLDRRRVSDAWLGRGWHAADREHDVRWTDGDARIEAHGAREMIVRLGANGRYWMNRRNDEEGKASRIAP